MTTPDSIDSGVSGSTIDKQDTGEAMGKKSAPAIKTGAVWRLTSPLSIISNNKVGSSYSSQQQPNNQALMNYSQQQLHQLQALTALPVSSRRVRDSGSLLFMLAFLGFLAYVIWDGIYIKQIDINLIVHGHDSYGNICGRANQPIKFVEKSGKNYSSKPYTKYTLINAQFERFTLDSEKLRQGELFYVKLDTFGGRSNGSSPADNHPEADEYKLEYARNAPVPRSRGSETLPANSNKTAPSRRKRNSLLSSSIGMPTRDPLAAPGKSQSPLKQLKSGLMYQYPLFYGGYDPPSNESSIGSRRGPSSQAGAGLLSRPEPLDRAKSGGLGDFVSAHSAANNRFTLRSGHVHGLGATLRPPTSQQVPGTGANYPATRNELHFDELPADDGADHMLIAPSNTNNLKPRKPDGLNANEVGSQLLYLTECVDHCPSDHVELIFYRCMPKNWRFSLFPNAINVTRTFIDDIFTDMTHCYKELIYVFSLALVLSLGLLILLRFLASLIIWSCLMLLVGLLLSMASYAWLNYYYLILDLNDSLPNNSAYADKLASSDKWLVGAIFLTFVTFAAVATILFMRKRILMVTMLFRESGKAIADMPLLLLQPLLTFATLVAITIIWSVGLICLQSIKTPAIDMSTGFVLFKSETLYKVMKWYHIFAFLWISHFAIACQHFVIGSSVSKWYFSTDRYNLHSPIGSSVSELVLYYLGSVALGSFLVAIFKVIKIVVRQIQYLVQRNCMQPQSGGQTAANGSSTLANGGSTLIGGHIQASSSWCNSCSYLWRMFIWFFDNIVMIINRDAYVEVAIHGHSFLRGAQRALAVLASNPLRLLAIKSVGSILLVVAKVCVVLGTVSMALVLLDDKSQQLNYSWSPMVISALFAYVVAHWFLSVYEMVIDALFICYCEDYERSKRLEAPISSNHINGSNFMAQVLGNGQIY